MPEGALPSRRTVSTWIAVALAILATGCAGIPQSGPIRLGRGVTAAAGLDDTPDVRVLPRLPSPHMSPTDIVRGFLRATASNDGDYETARAYLTPHAAATWDAQSAVTTYDDSRMRLSLQAATTNTRLARLVVPREGVIDRRGDFTPQSGDMRVTLVLTRQGGEWRIDRLPSGVLLSTTDAQRSYRLGDVYYLDRPGTSLVPEQVLLRPDPQGITTALVRALLSGPGAWLAPAVGSGIPRGTDLLGNVPVSATGVAEINMSAAVRQASANQLKQLSAQLLWTLRQLSEITGMRLFADGSPLAVPGVPLTQPRNAWPSFTPEPAVPHDAAFFRTPAGWRHIGGKTIPAAAGTVALALNADGTRLAGVRESAAGQQLVTGSATGPLRPVLRAATLTTPTFDPAGDTLTVATRAAGRSVAVVSTTGAVHVAEASAAITGQPVQSLQLSRDGARAAAVVGLPGNRRLLVGRVSVVRGRLRLDAFRNVLPTFRDVRAASWAGPDQLVAITTVAGVRELVDVDVDGYSTHTIPIDGLPGAPDDVAFAHDGPLLVSAAGAVWADDANGGWRRVATGESPGYPG